MKKRRTVEERFAAATSMLGEGRGRSPSAPQQRSVLPSGAPGGRSLPLTPRLGLAVSGGSDSMALMHLAARHLAGSASLVVLCFDHAIEGENSAAEFAFVESAAKRLGLPFLGRRANPPVRAGRGRSLEMAARNARRAFFAAAARELRLDAIATAHQRDDVAETLLLRLLRGAGASGLSGLRPFSPETPQSPAVVRPLLDCGREELRAWLRRRRIRWMDDIANSDESIPRCRVRLSLIPEIARIMGKPQDEIAASLAQSAAILRDEDEFLDSQIQHPSPAISNPKSQISNLKFQISDFRFQIPAVDVPAALSRRMIRKWLLGNAGAEASGFDCVEALRNAHAGDAVNLPGGAVIDIDAHRVATIRRAAAAPQRPMRLPIPGVVGWGRFSVATEITEEVERHRETPNRWPTCCTPSLRAVRESGGLCVRSRRAGETMAPFGFGGTKKLQDIFVDGRIPVWLRGSYPVVAASGDNRVAWLPGYRIAATFAVAKGEKAVRITVEEGGHEG